MWVWLYHLYTTLDIYTHDTELRFWNSGFRPEIKHFTNLHQYLHIKGKKDKKQTERTAVNLPTLVPSGWFAHEFPLVCPPGLEVHILVCRPNLSAVALLQLNPTRKWSHTVWMFYIIDSLSKVLEHYGQMYF